MTSTGGATSPRVSVVIPSCNTADYTEGAVQSVLAQTLQDFEVVLVDDGSDEESASALRSLASDARLRLLRREHAGAARARRSGWEAARGEFVSFLDDDDRYAPRYLERCLECIADDPGVDAVYTAYHFVTPSGERLRRLPVRGHSGRIFRSEVHKGRVKMSTLLVRRRCLLALSDLREDFRTSAEYDLILRLCHAHDFRYLDEALVNVIQRPGSLSSDRSRRHRNRAAILENLLRVLPDLERAERRSVEAKLAKYYAKAAEQAARDGSPENARELARRSLSTRWTRRGLATWLRSARRAG